jgi:hypothetical protein
MATTITGPGIAGAASEIAAVSVGVYATTNGFDAGMSHVRQTTQQTAVAVEQQMAVAGASIQSNIVGGAVEGAKGFRKAIKGLEKTAMTGFIGVAFVTGAFQLGQKIGNALVGGFDKEGKVLEQRLARLADVSSKAMKQEFEKAAEATKTQAADLLAAQQQSVEYAKKVKALRGELETLNRTIANNEETQRVFPSDQNAMALLDALERRKELLGDPEAKPPGARSGPAAGLEYQKKLLGEIEFFERKRLENADLYESKINRTNKLESDALKLKVEQEESERRIAAMRDVAADRMAASNAQLARLLDLRLRQVYPPQQGGGMVRY